MSQRLDRRYTAREAAEGLDVDLKYVRRWIRNGWLLARRPNRLNNRYRIRLAAIKRAMRNPNVIAMVGRRLQWRARQVGPRSTQDTGRSPTPPASPPAKSPLPSQRETASSQQQIDDSDDNG